MKQTILITGSSDGIGFEFARHYAKDNNHLILVSRSLEKLKTAERELKKINNTVSATLIPIDLSKSNSGHALYSLVKEKKLEVDILINNAGAGYWGYFAETDMIRELEIIQLNLITLYELTKLFLIDMKKRKKGKILNVSSVGGFIPWPKMSIYYATKSFVNYFSETIACEARKYGIQVSYLCPGYVSTNFPKMAGSYKKRKIDFKPKTPEYVVEYALRQFNQGKIMIIPGTFNKLLQILSCILPKNIQAYLIYHLQK